jgi:osmotically inducible protein OsmC
MAIRTASAEWKGDLQGGNGTFSSASQAIGGDYSFQSRFGDGSGGTNPEELIAAAHASCFSMALSGELGGAGHTAESVRTEARVHLLKDGDGFSITRIDLVTTARVPGIEDAAFQQAAAAAKAGCPISRALAAVPEITLDATLES